MRGTTQPRFCPPFFSLGISGLILLTFVLPGSCEDLSSATNASWSQVGGDVYGAAEAYSYFGTSVSISDDGTRMAVGQPHTECYQNPNYVCAGGVHVFELRSGSWVQMGSNIIGDAAQFDRAGTAVAISGNGMRVAVGSPQHSPGGCTGTGCNRGAGRVSVYEWVTGYWSQIGGHLVGDRCETNDPDDECIWYSDNLGYSVSLSYDGKYLAVGAFTYVMVYEWKHGFIWEPHYASSGDEVKYLDAGTGRYYGRVRISGDGNRLAIAAGNWRRADGGSAQGTQARLRVFERVYNPSGTDYWVKLGADLPSVNAGWDGGRSPSTSISHDGSIVSFSGGGENFCWLKVFQYNEDSSSWEQMGSTCTVDMTDFFCGTTLGDLSNDGLSIAVRHNWYSSMADLKYTPPTVDLRRWDPSSSSWAFVDGTRLVEPMYNT